MTVSSEYKEWNLHLNFNRMKVNIKQFSYINFPAAVIKYSSLYPYPNFIHSHKTHFSLFFFSFADEHWMDFDCITWCWYCKQNLIWKRCVIYQSDETKVLRINFSSEHLRMIFYVRLFLDLFLKASVMYTLQSFRATQKEN